MQNYFLGTPRNVSKNKESLLRNEIIIEVNGEFKMIDPAFELWFRRVFLKETI